MGTEMKHTPGPWWPVKNTAGAWEVKTYRDKETAESAIIGWKWGATICSQIGDHTEARTRGNEKANARLIAAAPELLEALQLLLDDMSSNALQDHALDKARFAIAKATGKELAA